MHNKTTELADVLEEISAMPRDLHSAGSLGRKQLEGIVRHCSHLNIEHTLETGSGKSTLLFSHLSPHHVVFAMEERPISGISSNKSISNVFHSSMLNQKNVELVEGPTQQTLPRHSVDYKVQVALLDGPHAYPFADLEYYYVYPLLEPDGVLIIDDINIPTIHNMYRFIEADEMFSLLELIGNTAFFQRTAAATFDPFADGHWLQNYNKVQIKSHRNTSVMRRIRKLLPHEVQKVIQRGRSLFY